GGKLSFYVSCLDSPLQTHWQFDRSQKHPVKTPVWVQQKPAFRIFFFNKNNSILLSSLHPAHILPVHEIARASFPAEE
ncbi:unnamed protein product, partial [Ixodes pacificus]